MALLDVNGLQIFYGDLQAVFDMNFLVGEGEAVALVGANGAGKSTFLKVLVGLNEARMGSILFDGIDISAMAAEQISRLAFGPRIDVGHREQPTTQQAGELGGVDPIGLGLTAVNELHVEGVAQDEGDAVVLAQVGEPVPGEHALAPDDETVAVRLDGAEEGGG